MNSRLSMLSLAMPAFEVRRLPVALALLLACVAPAVYAAAVNGEAVVKMAEFEPGSRVDLTGQWMYKPGYLLPDPQKPQLATTATSSAASARYDESTTEKPEGYVSVPVPQILSRIQWWLDDSEDFKKHETERLSKLGFDADKAEDGWYRLNVNLNQLPPGRRLYVQFDGVAMRSQVFWNGVSLGTHNGMFSRFEYEVTPYVRPGANTLAVFVSMEKIGPNDLDMGQAVTVNLTASKVKTMNKAMFGPMSPGRANREYDLHGIWQPVRLVCTGTNRIEDVWFKPSLDGAVVDVSLPWKSIMSYTPESGHKLRAQWIDEKTSTVFAAIAPAPPKFNNVPVKGRDGQPLEMIGTTARLELRDVHPKLWTPAEPNLYKLVVTLLSPGSGNIEDTWSHNVGFRTFEARGNQLYLNGKPYWLRGANHLPYGKNPTDPALARKLIQAMHDNNQRVTRTHCTPWNEPWLDAADEIGLGISIEGPRPWAFAGKIGATPPDLMQHWLMENDDIVRRCRNHPSVFIWCIGNEMLIRDQENVEKWAQLSTIVKQTRELDPTRPIVCYSSYERDPKLYNKVVKPNNFDDGDVDALHSYKGWYTESTFAAEPLPRFDSESTKYNRPCIGQEMSTGYPDLDTGLPVLRYTADIMTPQAWIGTLAYPGNDPKWFLEHHAIVTKRWAEQLRYQRGTRTSGFLMFANECWFNHSYDAKDCDPYPVVEAMKQAWAPVGIALETNRRRFYWDEKVHTNVFITNDDESFRDLGNAELIVSYTHPVEDRQILVHRQIIAGIKYYETLKVPIELHFEAPLDKRDRTELSFVLKTSDGESQTSASETIEIHAGLSREKLAPEPGTLVVKAGESLDGVAVGGALRQQIESGATAIVYSPGAEIIKYFPDDVLSSTKVIGEFADSAPAVDTRLTRNLGPMDIKWWAREGETRAYVASQAHRLKPGGRAREIIRFIPSHGYIRPERVPEQLMTVLFEIPLGKGRLWVCDLDLDKCAPTDPAAQLLQENLFAAAADPRSTEKLKVLPSHEEMLKDAIKHHKPTVGVYQSSQ